LLCVQFAAFDDYLSRHSRALQITRIDGVELRAG